MNQVISMQEQNNHSTHNHKPMSKINVNSPAIPNLLESSFPPHQRTKNRIVYAKQSLQHHAWFTTDECFTLHCPGTASRMLGHGRCRETPRGKWWSRTTCCEHQGSLGAKTCLLRGRRIGTASRVVKVLLQQQNNSKQTCSTLLLTGREGLNGNRTFHAGGVHQNPQSKLSHSIYFTTYTGANPVAARSAAARLLGMRVRISPGAWIFVLYNKWQKATVRTKKYG